MDLLEIASEGAQASQSVGSFGNKAIETLVHETNKKKIPQCKICSFKEVFGYKKDTGKIRHKHFSSRVFAKKALKRNKDGMYPCPTCNKRHEKEVGAKRLKVCVTSSALAEYWMSEKVKFSGDDFHIEWICIPGATINQLSAAWEIEFGDESRPMDVLLVGGLTNVIKETPGLVIVRAYKHFIDIVQWQGEQNHPDEPNTCAIGTMYYPPSLCWLDDDGPAPSNFINHLKNMRWLNHQIELLNMEAGTKSPNFPTFGVRKVTRNGRGKTRHRFEHWRESERAKMLHLSDDQRIKMAKQVARYFAHNTGW